MSKKRFEFEPESVAALNRRAESVQRAAAKILGVSVPLVVFDKDLQVPTGHQFIEGAMEETQFGVAITPQRIKMHSRELIALADSTASRFPGLSDQELSKRVDSQIWKFLVTTTVEVPAQGREDFRDIVQQTFSAAFDDWASREYGVTLPQKKS